MKASMFNKVALAQQEAHNRLAAAFLRENIPTLHQRIMRLFPWTVKWFDYSIAQYDANWQKMMLVKGASGKKPKVIARNFEMGDV